nr:MAG TPA: hypothetical protein [Caudoviricetes sp.]
MQKQLEKRICIFFDFQIFRLLFKTSPFHKKFFQINKYPLPHFTLRLSLYISLYNTYVPYRLSRRRHCRI